MFKWVHVWSCAKILLFVIDVIQPKEIYVSCWSWQKKKCNCHLCHWFKYFLSQQSHSLVDFTKVSTHERSILKMHKKQLPFICFIYTEVQMRLYLKEKIVCSLKMLKTTVCSQFTTSQELTSLQAPEIQISIPPLNSVAMEDKFYVFTRSSSHSTVLVSAGPVEHKHFERTGWQWSPTEIEIALLTWAANHPLNGCSKPRKLPRYGWLSQPCF